MSIYGSGHCQGIHTVEMFPNSKIPFTQKYWVIPPGGGETLHVHKNLDEIYTILEGVGEMTISNKITILEVGGTAYVPSGLYHTIRNKGTTPLRVLMTWWHYDWMGCAHAGST